MKVFLRRLIPGENTRLLLIAAAIGLLAGMLVIVFRLSLIFVWEHFFVAGKEFLGIAENEDRLFLLPLLPMGGMILLYPLSRFFPGDVGGYGFPKFLRKVNIEGGVLPARSIIARMLATALTIGSGNSAGMEVTTAQISGALGSQFGKALGVSGEKMKIFIAAGCASGIAGLFNAPLAGIFFAAEIVLLGTFEMASFTMLVVASALSTVITRAWFGDASLFVIPEYQLVSPLVELPLYALLAVLVGFLSVFFIRLFYTIRDAYQSFDLPIWLKTLTGAIFVGMIGLAFPQVMGDGAEFMERTMSGSGDFRLLLALVFLKMLATALTLGSGGAGGLFGPVLFIGAMLGGAFGQVAHLLWPTAVPGPGAYASVGAGAFLAATNHAPMTAIFLLFEMTGNSNIIVPAMLTCLIGATVARWLYPDSLDGVDFRRDGITLEGGRETVLLQSLHVNEALSRDVDFISEDASISQLLDLFASGDGDNIYVPVIDERGCLTGVIAPSDIKGLLHLDHEKLQSMRVGEHCRRQVVTLSGRDSLYKAMQVFDSQGYEEIPVVDGDHAWLQGIVKRRAALALYRRKLAHRNLGRQSG
jgi:CIC family chloride channel protein